MAADSCDIFEMEDTTKKEKYVFPQKKTLKLKIRKILYRRLPILEWLPKYNKVTAVSDLIAGVTLGLTLIPQSIAYASLANLTAQYGLYSSFMGKYRELFLKIIIESELTIKCRCRNNTVFFFWNCKRSIDRSHKFDVIIDITILQRTID